jgi:nucleoside-diphosphate-sugar epimerase
MRILVIGGTGFVGPHVIGRLVSLGHQVAIFHRGRAEADLPGSVIHFHGDREKLGHFRSELAGFAPEVVLDTRPLTEVHGRDVMSAFKGLARRVVALSSGDVYRAYDVIKRLEAGPITAGPLSEDAPLRRYLYPYRQQTPRAPDDPMRWADDYEKILVERAVMGEPELPGTILRLPMIYGPGDESHRLFGYLKRMDDGRRAILLEPVHSRWRWSRGYVENVADAIVLTIEQESAAGRIYNVGEPEALSEAEWVRAIGQVVGWSGVVVSLAAHELPPRLRPAENFHQHLVYDTSRIRAELGYIEHVSRTEALRRTVDWERAHPPRSIDAAEFDYASEDAALARIGAVAQ